MRNTGDLIARMVRDGQDREEVKQAMATVSHDYTTDTYVEILLDEILASNTPKEFRARSLFRLLSVYGVGTIVQGRLN
jgi:hypothetical protein